MPDAAHVGGEAVDAVTVDAAQVGLYEAAGGDGGAFFGDAVGLQDRFGEGLGVFVAHAHFL